MVGPNIVHVAYGGVAGSPRGTLLLAQGEKKVANPSIVFIGPCDLHEEYKSWAVREKIPFEFVKMRGRADLFFPLRLMRAIERHSPNVLFIHGTINLFFLLPYVLFKRKMKSILVEHGPGIHLDGFLAGRMGSLAHYVVNGVVYVSQDVCDYWKEKYGKLPRFSMVVPNGVDVSEFDGVVKGDSPVKQISMVAVMSEQKDHLTLIRAIRRLIDKKAHVRLVLVGDGPKRSQIEEEIKNLKLSEVCTIVLPPPRKQVIEIFKNSDVYVLSTHGEGLSRSILEAMCAKVPVIATKVSGTQGFIEEGVTGLLVPVGDPGAMADAILRVLKDKELAKELSKNAFEKVVAEHSIESAVKKYIDFMKKLGISFNLSE